jgi:uncharacterized protein YgbK (DUF1537 family)
MYAVTVVADDLTGAMDTAHGFAARGYGTIVRATTDAGSDAIGEGETPVLGLTTESRYATGSRASRAVSEAIAAFPAETVYKKVDSTLRGNVVREADAALDAAGAPLAVVAPAFPAAGRTTEDGVHRVDGTPVHETEYGADERGPALSSLRALFDAADRPVYRLRATVLEEGKEAARSRLETFVARSDRPPFVVCDASTEDHLATVATAGDALGPVYVGSGGLAAHLPVPGERVGRLPSPPDRTGAPLCVAGSVSGTTLAQLDRLPSDAVIELEGPSLLSGRPDEPAVERALDRLGRSEPVVVTGATDRTAVDRTLELGRDEGLDHEVIRDRVATSLGRTAARVGLEARPSGFVMTGGSVALATFGALEAATVGLTGDSVMAGIPIGVFADGPLEGTSVITKAGGFGTEETIVNCLNALGTSRVN